MSILGAIPIDVEGSTGILAHIVDSAGAFTISAGGGRSGASIHATSFTTLQKNLSSVLTTINIHTAIKFSTLSNFGSTFILQICDTSTASPQITLMAQPDGSLQVRRGSATGTILGSAAPSTISAGVVISLEMAITIDATVGTVDVWVNNASVLHLTGQNTKATSNTTCSIMLWSCPASTTTDYCDMIWANARINDSTIETIVPTGAGNYTQFTPSAGSNWQNVDEIPPNDDTDFNDTTTVGNIDSFTHAALSGSPNTISAVIVNVRAKNTTTGSGSVAPFVRSSTTDSPGTAQALNTNYQDFQAVYNTDPATSVAWTTSGVNSCEFGYKRTA